MGIFNFFKQKGNRQEQSQQSILNLQGPKYLRNQLTPLTADIAGNFKIQYPGIQWLGQLLSKTQNRHFRIKYYGNLMNDETIIDTDEGVHRLIAIDTESNEEILVFDKMLHGWDGSIYNAYQDQINVVRNPNKLYKSKNNTDKFQIVFLAFYNDGTKEELLEFATPNGQIQLENGVTLDLQDAFDDAFDAVVIYGIDENGNKFELINEELA